MSEISNLYPKEWQFRKLEEIASNVTSGGTPTSGSARYYCTEGGYPFAKTEDLTASKTKFLEYCELKITGLALLESSTKIYPEGTVLISMYGTIGLTKITKGEIAANQALCALIPPLQCDTNYLYQYLEFIRPDWKKYSGQTTQANINGATVRAHVVPLPLVDEQRKIAQILGTLDTAIQQTEAIVEKLKQVKQGLLHDLLTRGVDANGELRPSHEQAPTLYQASPLGWIPKDWDAKPLNNSIQLISGQHIATNLCNSVGRGVPYFTGPSDFVGAETVITSFTSYPQVMCEKGDLLITVKGSGCGKIAVAGARACISRQLMAIRITEKESFYWFAIFQNLQPKFNRMATGGNIPGIGRDQILNFLQSTPKKSEEMEAIGIRIQTMDAQFMLEKQKLAKLKLQKNGLMDDLLTGRVRVTPLLDAAP